MSATEAFEALLICGFLVALCLHVIFVFVGMASHWLYDALDVRENSHD